MNQELSGIGCDQRRQGRVNLKVGYVIRMEQSAIPWRFISIRPESAAWWEVPGLDGLIILAAIQELRVSEISELLHWTGVNGILSWRGGWARAFNGGRVNGVDGECDTVGYFNRKRPWVTKGGGIQGVNKKCSYCRVLEVMILIEQLTINNLN